MSFTFPETISLAQLPTPIQEMKRLTKLFEGPQLFIKRDDFTGIGLSGNKVRKLEFLMAEAVRMNCDTVMTCGGHQSNHARTTALAAAKIGLKCYLMLRNNFTAPYDGNLFLDKLAEAEIQFVTSDEYDEIDKMMRLKSEELKEAGRKPYIIPEGGSNELGSLGYLRAMQEIVSQMKSSKLEFDHILVPVGSGGTIAGLLLGKHLYEYPGRIIGINVCDDASYFKNKVFRIINAIKTKFELNIQIPRDEIEIIDGYVGKGYGLSSQAEIDLIKKLAAMEGIILDPVYTGKAMYGVYDQIINGAFKSGEKMLFIHTGGIFGLFPKRNLFY